jgi:hypothetical protein
MTCEKLSTILSKKRNRPARRRARAGSSGWRSGAMVPDVVSSSLPPSVARTPVSMGSEVVKER